MAGREYSTSFSEFDTEDLSLETTVPTDFSDEAEGDRSRGGRARKEKVTKQLIERKQLAHDLQLVRIELSQKNLIIENLKAEHVTKVEELEEKLSDALHQRHILQAKLESQLKMHQEESRRRQEQTRAEIERIMQRQQQLETANARLQAHAGDIRRSLRDLNLAEGQYFELKGMGRGVLNISRYMILVHLLVIILTAVTMILPLPQSYIYVNIIDFEGNVYLSTVHFSCMQNLKVEKQGRSDAEVKCQRLTLELADTKSQIQQGDYKRENYDRVKSERDDLEHEVLDSKKKYTYLDAAHRTVSKERDDTQKELSAAKQALALLRQDKDYLTKHTNDLGSKMTFNEERLQQLTVQLDDAKRAREEMYEKYVASRDHYKAEYERRLAEELDQIRVKTDQEMDRLRVSTREMYERENRNLREARDAAVAEKERLVLAEREATRRSEDLVAEFRQLQNGADTKTSELQNELKLKSFETERTQMVHEETVRNLKQCQIDNEKLQNKLEVMTREYYELQRSTEKQFLEMETQNKDLKSRVETYEKLEQELDDVVMQAAEVENEDEAERVLFSYGYGANVPSTAKRRLKQSVHLARRVLQLERQNTSLRKDMDRQKTEAQHVAEELSAANRVLDQSQQPYSYLIESLRLRDSQINAQKNHIQQLQEDLSRFEKERADLIKTKNQMTSDLERLLNQREEMAVMKQVVQSLHSRRYGDDRPHPQEASTTSTAVRSTGPRVRAPLQDSNTYTPAPTLFTNRDPPEWYKRVKQRSGTERTKYSQVYATS
ncbi:PREDICTED: progesterone-induced-blocking factor 1-like [Branchiostoma belcheri]|uniref:Progesterone-induced-blocking factor 1-like n=1 Tax=Branchiostoma belcheri TaxID=7741 RepID=A0A6P5AWD6_BRABE|nr:PREDICTED: progesterone-induced-blocking factor 1-like [Branchiostoma belcheri]